MYKNTLIITYTLIITCTYITHIYSTPNSTEHPYHPPLPTLHPHT